MEFESALALIEELRATAPPSALARARSWREAADHMRSVLESVEFKPASRLLFREVSAARWPLPVAAKRRLVTRTASPVAVTAATRPALGVAHGRHRGDVVLAIRLQSRSGTTHDEVERITARANGEVDVDYIGPLRIFGLGLGSSVGRLRPVSMTGSAGCFVDRSGEPGPELLSCNHVLGSLGRGEAGDPILSPGPADGGTSADRAATLTKIVQIDPLADNEVDAALALLDSDPHEDPGQLPDGQRLTAPPPEPIRPGIDVMKIGRSTGATSGHLRAVGVGPVAIDYSEAGGGLYSFSGLLEIRSRGPAGFSSPGDSGALIWESSSGAGIGALVAGPSRAAGPLAPTFAVPLSRILETLGATLRLG